MRHRQRHLHRTVYKHVQAALTEGGWIQQPINWGQPAVTMMDYEPQEAGETPAYNTVAVSIGTQGETEAFELGGGLHVCEYTVFIDVYPTKEAIGVAIADDIKDALTEYIIPLRDYSTTTDGVETDARIEFDRVLVENLTSAASTLDKRAWRSVKATAVCYF